ncbi:hypothetical protein E0H93_36200 [Rhizobium leguminosarum bv. viciae]|nr:hypothetical protein E0H55_36680 [Rhizobium leguminosarum bv. viciae]TBZ56555.1 hypothetical protein E0H64_36185 [Rhizobium leguminosarum bv. viciae]TCA93270.1 hypothetical protein E0H93_36200 [Rhizobium leguminosarum bv. viciae]
MRLILLPFEFPEWSRQCGLVDRKIGIRLDEIGSQGAASFVQGRTRDVGRGVINPLQDLSLLVGRAAGGDAKDDLHELISWVLIGDKRIRRLAGKGAHGIRLDRAAVTHAAMNGLHQRRHVDAASGSLAVFDDDVRHPVPPSPARIRRRLCTVR